MQKQNRRVWVVVTVIAALGLCGPVVRAATEDETGPALKIDQQTAHNFVVVSFHLKKSDRPYMNEADGSEWGPGPSSNTSSIRTPWMSSAFSSTIRATCSHSTGSPPIGR